MLKLLKRLCRKVNPREFTDDPEDFLIKNEASWFSNKHRNILYSGNKGESWKRLKEYCEPLFTYYGACMKHGPTWEDVTINSETTSFREYRKRFPDLLSITTYLDKQQEYYKQAKLDHAKKQEQYLKEIKANIQN